MFIGRERRRATDRITKFVSPPAFFFFFCFFFGSLAQPCNDDWDTLFSLYIHFNCSSTAEFFNRLVFPSGWIANRKSTGPIVQEWHKVQAGFSSHAWLRDVTASRKCNVMVSHTHFCWKHRLFMITRLIPSRKLGQNSSFDFTFPAQQSWSIYKLYFSRNKNELCVSVDSAMHPYVHDFESQGIHM